MEVCLEMSSFFIRHRLVPFLVQGILVGGFGAMFGQDTATTCAYEEYYNTITNDPQMSHVHDVDMRRRRPIEMREPDPNHYMQLYNRLEEENPELIKRYKSLYENTYNNRINNYLFNGFIAGFVSSSILFGLVVWAKNQDAARR